MAPAAPIAPTEGAPIRFVLQLKWLHQLQFAGYDAALENGCFAAEGLDVEIRPGGPAIKVDREVIEGRAHFGVLASELIEKRLAGEPLVLLSVIFQHSPRTLIFRADGPIRTPSDLISRRIMLHANERAEFMALFLREGIDPAGITILPKDRTANTGLMQGQIDAINGNIANQPFLFASRGVAVRTFRPIDYGVDFYGDSLFTSEEALHRFPDQTAAFRRPALRGWDYAFRHVEETIDLIRSRFRSDKSAAHLRFEAEAMRGLVLPELVDLGHVNPGRIQRIITEASRRMQTLVQDLLAYSRSGRLEIKEEFAPLGDCLAAAAENLGARLKETNVKLRSGAMPTVRGDATALTSVFQNLIGNALKFHRPDVAPEIQIQAQSAPEGHVIQITDNGIGIEEQYLEQIFLPFKRLHGKKAYSGSGLGLAIVKKILERHGGSIGVSSTPGQGSVFTLALPNGKNDPAHQANTDSERAAVDALDSAQEEADTDIGRVS